ncbi:MAG TPA: hypothetical protein VKW76_07205 [Candidatus Binatia bacterium]|nr:hypothetical protein [Candidatus Binatia bacterium]
MADRALVRLALATLVLVLPALPASARRARRLTLRVPAFTVPPNSDREVCTFVAVPADQPYDVVEVAIANRRVPRGVRFTSHHFLLYAYTGKDVSAFAPYEGKVKDSHGCIDFGPSDTNARVLLGGSQSPTSDQRDQPGLAQQVMPLADAHGRSVLPFILNSHWINGSRQGHRASVVVKLVPAKPHTIRRLLNPIFAVTANAALDVPPQTVRSTESSTAATNAALAQLGLGIKLVDAWGPGMTDFGAAFGGAPIPKGPACVTYLTGHMHKRGEVFAIDYLGSDGTVQNAQLGLPLFTNPDDPTRSHPYVATDYTDMGQLDFKTPRLVVPGESFHYACWQDNGVRTAQKLGCEEQPGKAPGRSIVQELRKGADSGAAKRCTTLGPDPSECPTTDPAYPGRTFTGNCVAANLVFGFTSDDEMCIMPGAYYDAVPGAADPCDISALPVIN